jgi:tRNA (uracil-5-)-methyltransferase TRM9
MEESVIQRLLGLNQQFYQTFAGAFSATRQRVQPGMRRLLPRLAEWPRLLDLGCGNGGLGAAWLELNPDGEFWGLDASAELLKEAAGMLGYRQDAYLLQADLAQPGWSSSLPQGNWPGITAFASLHHIPSFERRISLLCEAADLLQHGGWLVFSVWQFQNSPRLLARVQPWSAAGLDEAQLEAGDTLLDWRASLPGQPEQRGLRYVHQFSSQELAELAAVCGFRQEEEFESDGEGGRLGWYQVWGKK